VIQEKVFDAGQRMLPELERSDLFNDEANTKMRRSLFQYEFKSAMLNTARVCILFY